jgi:Protein of unknown function (DUF3891)
MVLYPLHCETPSDGPWIDAWEAVFERQRARANEFLLVEQPAHARISGQIALAMTAPGLLPSLSTTVIQGIELHDEGWASFDRRMVEQIGAPGQRPLSFLECGVTDFLTAWSGSIRAAEAVAPIAGYIVSGHFRRLAQHRLNFVHDSAEDRQSLESFVASESHRQARLLASDGRDEAEALRLVTVLQFCDLLSLYLCSGSTRKSIFSQALFDNLDERITIRAVSATEFVLRPTPFTEPLLLRVGAKAHPRTVPGRILEWTLS